MYDEAWSQQEIAVLEAYVAEGGLLVLTNSANRLKYHNWLMDPNEDWDKANVLAEQFGIRYQDGELRATRARVEGGAPTGRGRGVAGAGREQRGGLHS